MKAEATSSAFTTLFGLAVAGGAAIGNSMPSITIAGSLLGALGGAIGGVMLVMMVSVGRDHLDKALAVFLSMIMGFAFSPVTAIYLGHQFGWWNPGDIATTIPVGAAIGATMPLLYPLFAAAIQAMKENPAGAVDWFKKARDAMPEIRIGGKRDE